MLEIGLLVWGSRMFGLLYLLCFLSLWSCLRLQVDLGSRFTVWVDGDVVFVKLRSTGSVRVITRRVLEKCWRIAVDMTGRAEDPFQPAWFYKTTNGTYIARIFRYVIEDL